MEPLLSSAATVEQARFQALARLTPIMFLAVCAVMAAVVTAHAFIAPWPVLLLFPPCLLAAKAAFWFPLLHRFRHSVPSSETCRRTLWIISTELVCGMSMIVIWEIVVAQWATPESMVLLGMSMGGQMVFLLFGLLHLRMGSIIATSICVLGMLYIAGTADGVGVGVVLLVVGGVAGLAYVAYQYSRDFGSLVTSRATLERRAAEISALSEQNFRIANTDMLTEIGNRRSCFHAIEGALGRSRETGVPVSLGIIDLDGFKTVNDSNGHLVGDRLLRAMAERLQDVLAPYGGVYRLGGDEFAFLIPGEDDEGRLLAIGDQVIAAVNMPITIGSLRLLLGCSIGFASFPRTAEDAIALYDRADYALFHAKRTGRLKPVVFNAEHESSVRENALVERTLRAADLERELYLSFQPIVDSHKDVTVLLECLARWQSPVLGAVSPGKFIVVAEQSGFISQLTPILLRKALDAIRQWPDAVGISFNLSGHDIVAADKVTRLIDILAASGVSPHRVEFEVTETALMMNLDEALANIHRLKATGARISLDDFGTGYSSLSQIQKLPLDKIKVDGSFVRDLAHNEASRKIVRSVSALSRDLALSCVVEGVETREQLDILQDIGCSLIQGYFYSKPMREDQVDAWLTEQARVRAGGLDVQAAE